MRSRCSLMTALVPCLFDRKAKGKNLRTACASVAGSTCQSHCRAEEAPLLNNTNDSLCPCGFSSSLWGFTKKAAARDGWVEPAGFLIPSGNPRGTVHVMRFSVALVLSGFQGLVKPRRSPRPCVWLSPLTRAPAHTSMSPTCSAFSCRLDVA